MLDANWCDKERIVDLSFTSVRMSLVVASWTQSDCEPGTAWMPCMLILLVLPLHSNMHACYTEEFRAKQLVVLCLCDSGLMQIGMRNRIRGFCFVCTCILVFIIT